MFRRLIRIFIATTEPSVLGRWSLTDMKKNKIKIDWANIDHCGTCKYIRRIPKKPDLELHELVDEKKKVAIIPRSL